MAGIGVGGATGAGTRLGAMIGTFLLPGLGTAIGGLIGGVAGAITGRSVTDRNQTEAPPGRGRRYEEKVEEMTTKAQETELWGERKVASIQSDQQSELTRYSS